MRILQRGLHALSVLVAVTLGGAVLFFVLGCVALRIEDYDSEVKWASIALGVVLLALVVWGVWKKVSYRVTLSVIGLCGGFVLYLVWDDAACPPPPEIPAMVPADSKSYEAYRWFVKGDPHSRLGELPQKSVELPQFPQDHAQWPEFFAKHREVFTQAWEKDTLEHAWIDAMAQHVPEGLFPFQENSAGPMLAFSPIRNSAKGHWGYAQVLMLDQRYDEAARLLVPYLRANYHLQRGGSSLVTEMISMVCIKGSYEQLEELVNTDKLSQAVRSEIAIALKESPPLQIVFRNAFLGEHMQVHASLLEAKDHHHESVGLLSSVDGSGIPASLISWRLFFNPNRSEWEYGEFLGECRRLADSRLFESNGKTNKNFQDRVNEWHMKNLIGQLMRQMATPAFEKATTGLWQTEDRRLALLKRLETP